MREIYSDGDIISLGKGGRVCIIRAIVERNGFAVVYYYASLAPNHMIQLHSSITTLSTCVSCIATQDQKDKLFHALRKKGYGWDAAHKNLNRCLDDNIF